MNLLQIKNELAVLKETQGYKKTFDFTRSFIAEAGKADSFAIPITNEGPFLQIAYNIKFTKNSTITRGGVTTNICAVKLKFKSQADNASQSNDFVPVQLIATPGDSSRYGARPFQHLYPKGDVLIIEYDNRQPTSLVAGDSYQMENEQIDICFTGFIYPVGN